jgi:hypothetical protein
MSSLILFINSVDRLLHTKYALQGYELTITHLSGIYVTGALLSISMSFIDTLQEKISAGRCGFIYSTESTKYMQGLKFCYHLLLIVGFCAVNVKMIHFLSTRKLIGANKRRPNEQKDRIMLMRLSFSTASNILMTTCVLTLQVIKLGEWDVNITDLALIETHVLLVNAFIHPFNETFTASKFTQFIYNIFKKTKSESICNVYVERYSGSAKK